MRRSSLPRVMLFWIALSLAVTAIASGFEATEERARLAAARMVERALACGESDIIPVTALAGARPGETVFVHDVETVGPLYGLVALTSARGSMVGVVAVDMKSDKCLWSSFNCPGERLLPVTAAGALRRLVAAGELAGDNETGEPLLISGRDKRLYWKYSRGADSWYVDAMRPEALILSSTDGSDRSVLARTETLDEHAGETAGLSDLGASGPEPTLTDPPPAYIIPGLPYHFQVTDWWCAPTSLQMLMDWYGAEIPQVDIAHVGNDRGPSAGGVRQDDLRRAAAFSGMSIAIQDSSLQGYNERQLGYACPDACFITNRAVRLKRVIAAGCPVIALTWWNPGHDGFHFRIIHGYDDSLDVFVCQDPWYWAGWWGPEVLIDQTYFADDLWTYGISWGMTAAPWILTPDVPPEVAVGDTFQVDLKVLYPGPGRFSGSYPCSTCEATLHLSPGLTLAGGSPTTSFPSMSAGDSAIGHWDVIAVGPPGEWGMSFQAQGLLTASCNSYPSYTDSIGGHAHETVFVGGAADDRWGPAEVLSDSAWSARTCFPGSRAMVVGDDGTLHAVWSDTRNGDSEIYYSRRTGYVWDTPARLTSSPGMSSNPCIAMSGNGRLHVAWSDYRDMTYEIYYKVWDPAGGWSADERVTDHAEVDYYPAIAAGDSTVYLVWEYHTGSSYRVAGVAFSRKTDAGWSVPVDVDDSYTRDSYRPTIACGPGEIVHVAYERQSADSPDELEQISYRSYNGTSWSARTLLSGAGSFSRTPSIIAGPDSTLHIVWQDGENTGGDIYYRKHDGIAWQPVEEIAVEGTEASTPSVASDAAGNVHVVWADNRHGEAEIYYREKGASGWGEPSRVSRGSGPSLLPAAGVTPSGEVCVLWTDSRSGVAGIYHSMRAAESAVEPGRPESPGGIQMALPCPQPFTTEMRMEFALTERTLLDIDVYDVGGRLVARLASGSFGPGAHHVTWDGSSRNGPVSPGVYFIQYSGPGWKQARKVVVLR
ncbi:MAG: C39 family peptidase [bacterium]